MVLGAGGNVNPVTLSVQNDHVQAQSRRQRSEGEASWLRLFDSELPSVGWGYVDYKGYSDKEAVFETLRLRDVRSVTHFIGCSRKARRRVFRST